MQTKKQIRLSPEETNLVICALLTHAEQAATFKARFPRGTGWYKEHTKTIRESKKLLRKLRA